MRPKDRSGKGGVGRKTGRKTNPFQNSKVRRTMSSPTATVALFLCLCSPILTQNEPKHNCSCPTATWAQFYHLEPSLVIALVLVCILVILALILIPRARVTRIQYETAPKSEPQFPPPPPLCHIHNPDQFRHLETPI